MAKKAKSAAKKTAKTKTKRTQKKTKSTDARRRIVDTALALAVRDGWRSVTLNSIATEAGLSLSDVYGRFPSKDAILAGFLDDIDNEVLAGALLDESGEPARDRLFDVLMRRFDALQPHKEAVAAILRDSLSNPLACLCGFPRLMNSMAAMLEAARLSSTGCSGLIKTKGLALVYLNALRVWLRDDTTDMSKTMAALDKSLRRTDSIASALFARRAA